MSISRVCGISILSSAILGGCGGSGGGSGTSVDGGQATQAIVEPLNVQPDPSADTSIEQNNDISQSASTSDTAAENTNGATEADGGATQADGGAVEVDSGSTDSDSPGAENSDNSTSSTDTTETPDDSAGNIGSSEAFANSTCQPGASAVSYETFYSVGGGNAFPFGVHVPFPASGFGWNGNQICDLEGSSGVDVIELLVPYVARRPDTDGVFNLSLIHI